MPTRPTRRERRRADRRNAKATASSPEPAPGSVAESGPVSPSIFMNAAPIVRAVMRIILIQTSFASHQVVGFTIWKKVLEDVLDETKHRLSASELNKCEVQMSGFNNIIELHGMYAYELYELQLDYVKQVVMWGLECSKTEEEWDMDFIARRRLEIAQLNRSTKKLTISFEEDLQELLVNEQVFPTEKEKMLLVRMLDRFRNNFVDAVETADMETAAVLKKMGHDLFTHAS